MGDYIKMPLVDHQDKTNIDMLKTVNPDNYVNGERKYGNAYYPTNQKQIFHENKALFFNYIFCYNGNGGIAISEFDKKSGKIDNIKLIPYHVIFDSTKSLNNEFRCKYVPELDITNLIEHNGNYYLVLENFSTQFLVTEYRSYYLGYSGNKYIVALDSNFNVKWADAYNLWHRFIMRGGNYTDSYRMQGSSQFYIKDDKLEGHIVIQPDQEQFNYVDMGFFKVSYDLETGKSEKKLITTVDKSRKVFYNSLYPVGNGSVLLDQNYQDELYLIKEK
jgi:hypothetical protein